MDRQPMEPQFQDDKLIARYLLGELSEEEQVQLEERAFSDSDYLERVRAVEKDLIDEYARGELSGSARQSFEQRFLASEPRRRQIEFAKAFDRVIGDEPANDAAVATSSRWYSLVPFWRGQRLAFAFSLAVVVLLVVIGGVWLLKQRAQSQREQAQRQSPPPAAPSVQESATPKLNDEQRVRSEPQPAPSPAKQQDQPLHAVVASLLLMPGTSRGAESHSQLVIAPATKAAQLRVALENGDEYKTYAVELRTSSGRLILNQAGLQAHAGHGGRAVVLTLPANILTTGDYEVTLNGINDQKRAEPLGYCYFSVRKD
jgi:hypothetical protein